MEITGTVTTVLPVETLNGGKVKQLFVVQQEGQYGKPAAIVNFNNKIQTPREGQSVTVSVNVESREYNGRYYTDLQSWKVDVNAAAVTESDDLNF